MAPTTKPQTTRKPVEGVPEEWLQRTIAMLFGAEPQQPLTSPDPHAGVTSGLLSFPSPASVAAALKMDADAKMAALNPYAKEQAVLGGKQAELEATLTALAGLQPPGTQQTKVNPADYPIPSYAPPDAAQRTDAQINPILMGASLLAGLVGGGDYSAAARMSAEQQAEQRYQNDVALYQSAVDKAKADYETRMMQRQEEFASAVENARTADALANQRELARYTREAQAAGLTAEVEGVKASTTALGTLSTHFMDATRSASRAEQAQAGVTRMEAQRNAEIEQRGKDKEFRQKAAGPLLTYAGNVMAEKGRTERHAGDLAEKEKSRLAAAYQASATLAETKAHHRAMEAAARSQNPQLQIAADMYKAAWADIRAAEGDLSTAERMADLGDPLLKLKGGRKLAPEVTKRFTDRIQNAYNQAFRWAKVLGIHPTPEGHLPPPDGEAETTTFKGPGGNTITVKRR